MTAAAGPPDAATGATADPAADAATDAPSPWLLRWSHRLAGAGTALDVAAGRGRHVRWLAARGLAVTAVDRDPAAARDWPAATEAIVADLEAGPWPLAGRSFDVVVVANYLWRPLLPAIVAAVAPGGVLVYETFAVGQERIGRPRNPDFLLRPGELLEATAGLRTIAYEDVDLDSPARVVQRIVAERARTRIAGLIPPRP